MKPSGLLRKRRFRPSFSVMIACSTCLMVFACLLPASAQEKKYDAVYESLHEHPAPPVDTLKTSSTEPVTDTALSLHPDVDTRNADDITTAISNRDQMPPLLSLPTGTRSSVNAGMNRRGPDHDSPTEFHRVTDSNHNNDDVYYLNLNIRF